jgi:hypothetical protein
MHADRVTRSITWAMSPNYVFQATPQRCALGFPRFARRA